MKPFTRITIVLLALVALSHLLRLVLGWDMRVDLWTVPLWASVLGVLIPGTLAFMLWREASSFTERRTSLRVRSQHLAACRLLEKPDVEMLVKTLDLSEDGARIESRDSLEEGQKLSLEIVLQEQLIHADGDVVHVETLGDGRYAVGVSFTEMEKADLARLRRYRSTVATAH